MTSNNDSESELAGPIYRSFVLSIFSDNKFLLLGIPTSVMAVLLTGYTSGSPVFYCIAAAMLALGVFRCVIISSFHAARKKSEFTLSDYRNWERRYTTCAVFHASSFGVWCFFGANSGNATAEFTSMVVTFANLIGVCGRGFPLSRLVNRQLLVIGIPLVAGLAFQGGVYIFLSLMLAPYLIGIRNITDRQRENLVNNVVNRRKAEKLASQFNNALESVPQGICMFNSAGKLEVANKHISKLFGKSSKSVRGVPLLRFIDFLTTNHGLEEKFATQMRAWALAQDQSQIAMQFELKSPEITTFKFLASRTESGGIIATFEDISQEIEAATRIDHMERFDRLTGLMNRNQLPVYLGVQLAEMREKHRCLVLLINIDRFKQVNDSLGHSKGDKILQSVAERLLNVSEGVGVCARYGGDEFAIAVREEDGLDLATNLADTICESFAQPFSYGPRRVMLGCSIGIAASVGQSQTAEGLLKNADLALLSAKQNGRGNWRMYNAEMSRDMQVQSKLENDLRCALTNGELEAHYQPIVSVKKGCVSVCEALIRWNHPTKGYISPGLFIPIAEELGLINEIGGWMLNEACKTCASWPEDVRVAVNLSAIQFRSGKLLETVRNALSESDLSPDRLELEITETLMMEDIGETVTLLHQFKGMGVRISLDDFGTGFSSLNYLNELPLDKVKIDRSFVLDLHKNQKSVTLVQAVTALGQKLDLTVVVEGIETTEQFEMLMRNAPVDEIQGYLFSKPVDTGQISVLLDPSQISNISMLSKLSDVKNMAA